MMKEGKDVKVIIFGATGRVGSEVLKLSLAAGHEVFVLVRSPEKLNVHPKLKVYVGDVRNLEDVEKVVAGSDVVFSALGTDKTTTLTEATPHILKAMKKNGIQRVVTIGTAGILQSRSSPDKLRYEAGDSNRKLTFAAEEHHKVYDLLRESELNWTIICPTYLPEGEAVGDYRIERSQLPINSERISVGDTASFAFDELMDSKHIGYRIGIAY